LSVLTDYGRATIRVTRRGFRSSAAVLTIALSQVLICGILVGMKNAAGKSNGVTVDFKAEARELRLFTKRVAGSKRAARRFLAATGMYTLKGELKPQFR